MLLIGYDDFVNPETGEYSLIDRETGEKCDVNTYVAPVGSAILTPQILREIERKKKAEKERLEREAEAAERERYRHRKPPFVFISSDKGSFEGVPADTMTRAAYLSTYLKFGTDELWLTKREKLKRKQLSEAMHISEPAANKFWRDTKDRFFYRDSNGFLHTTGKTFIRGPIKQLEILQEQVYQQLFISAIREIYEKIPPRQHKRLGYALKMLPFLNFEYNILCRNPEQTAFRNVSPLTVGEFCKEIGYDREHAPNLVREYGRLTFTVKDEETSKNMQEVFCKFLSDGENIVNGSIYINPGLIYRGSDPRKVAAIGVSFAADTRPI